MPRTRYGVLDTYRFLAALGVVFYHFEGHLSPFRPQPSDVLERFQTFVDFFFVLSGFVLMHTYADRVRALPDYRDFLRKRLARIYPLHLATLAVCTAIALVVALRHVIVRDPSFFDVSQLPENLLLIHAWGTTDRPGLNFASWSISAEFFVYLLFPLFALLVARVRAAGALIAAAGFAVIVELVRAHLGLRPGWLATYDWGALRAVPSFVAGMATCAIVEARPPRPVRWIWPNALALLVLALALARAPTPVIILLYPPLVGLVAAAERGGRPTLLSSPICRRLGDASFGIYMLHSFVAIACVALVRHAGWSSLPALCAVAVGGALVSIALALASYRFFETPMRRWLGRTPARSARGDTERALGLHRAS